MADYFVKNAGDDAKDGLSDANAWKTISKVNGSSFSAGDTISFNKGDTWREQLVPPSDGSSGSPITFGAYGTGADPIIDARILQTTWTLYNWLSGWNYRKKITIQSANVDANLSDFPVYVDITADSDIGGHVQDTTNGYDIRFTDANGTTLLKYEREYFNVTTGVATGHYWVKVPNVYASPTGTQNEIYIYYDDDDGTVDGEDANNVWDTNFQAVWHLKESSGSAVDSTGNGNTGTFAGNLPTQINGEVYKGQDLDGSGDYIDGGAMSSIEGVGAFTVSAWMKTDTLAAPVPNLRCALVMEAASAGTSTFLLRMDTSTDKMNFYVPTAAWGTAVESNVLTTTPIYHFAGVYNGSQYILYQDGASVGTPQSRTGNTNSCSNNLIIGKYGNGAGREWDGILDEIRISSTNRSVEWINFEYHNMRETDNELDWSSEEEPNVWKATCTTEAKSVYFDTTKGTLETAIANLNAANEWYWTANVLYVYSTVDPDTLSSPGMQVGLLNNYTLKLWGKSYVDIENINFIAGGSTAASVGWPDHINFTNVVFDGNNDGIHYPCVVAGSDIANWANNIVFDNCEFKDAGGSKSGLSIEDWSHDITIKNSSAHDNTDNGIQVWTSGAASSGPYNIIIENTDSYSNSNYGMGLSYHVKDSVIRYCRTYSNVVGFGGEAGGTGNEYYYNISYGNSQKGAEIDDGHTAANWYNNVFYDNGDHGIYIHSGASNGQVIKNNIFYGLAADSSYMIYVGGTVTITSDNNCFYDTGTNKWHWHGSDYTTFANWKTNSSQDASSINQDPVFIDASTNKYSLQSSSPCIDAGVDVSLTTDYAGSTVPAPSGGSFDIGAFEYVKMAPSVATVTVSVPGSITPTVGYNSAVSTGGAMGMGISIGM